MRNSRMYLLSLRLRKKAVSLVGIWLWVSTRPKMEAMDSTNSVAPANTEVSIRILKSFFRVRVLYTNMPIRIEYMVATQAPSVGVK